MATTNSHSPRFTSIPTTLTEAYARIAQLEAEAIRLRYHLSGIQGQIEDLKPGQYILTDEGDFNGPFSGDLSKIVREFTEEGAACTVINSMARHEAEAMPEDFGIIAGGDYPGTLAPAAYW